MSTIKTFRFPVSRAPEKIDGEIRDWAEKNGMEEVSRSHYTTFVSEKRGYLICHSEFKKAACNLTEKKLENMFD